MNVSIIIPALNEAEIIEQTLARINPATDIQIIVCDGGSKDNTAELSRKYAQVVNSPPGRACQMNQGERSARGELLLFLHADTLLPPGWKADVMEAMTDPSVAGGAFSLDIDSRRLSLKIIAYFTNIRARITGIPYGDQAIFVRRSVFEHIGGYKNIPVMEDVDLMQRLKKVGKVRLLKNKVSTSARRWKKDGVLYATIRNRLMIGLYLLGVRPERLYRFYKANA